jgi:hypothetical protein
MLEESIKSMGFDKRKKQIKKVKGEKPVKID